MYTTTLGSTDTDVSAVGFGAMHLSLKGRPDEADAIRVLHRVLDLGVTFIDTADAYCIDEADKHHNERLIRRALDAYDGDTSAVLVATKGGLMRTGGDWPKNGDPDHLRRTLQESAEILGRPLGLWQHHAPDPDVPIEASLKPVAEAVRDGAVRYVGVSNYSVEQIERAREVVEVVSVQNEYSPWHRQPEEDGVLDYCEREGLTFLPYSPLGGKSRAKSFDEYQDITALAREKGITPQRLVLAWLLHRADSILPIPGASRIETAEDSIQAAEVRLTSQEVRRIDEDAVR